MITNNVMTYSNFLLFKMQNEVKKQIQKNNQFIAETKEMIAGCKLSKLELQYYTACTLDYLRGPVSNYIQSDVPEIEAVPAKGGLLLILPNSI